MARKSTHQMTPVELARAFAEVRGYKGRDGGWIYGPNGAPVAHGWTSFARRLVLAGWITPGRGIDWRRSLRADGVERVMSRYAAAERESRTVMATALPLPRR